MTHFQATSEGLLSIQLFVVQEPRHGERWQAVAKDPANAHQPVDVILKKVVAHMQAVPLP